MNLRPIVRSFSAALVLAGSLAAGARAAPRQCTPTFVADPFPSQFALLPPGEALTISTATVDGEERLIVGGTFSRTLGSPFLCSRIASWDGTRWSRLGVGFDDGSVGAVACVDVGNGPRIFAGGPFTKSGGVSVARLAQWTGQSWAPVGSFTATTVRALVAHDDGSGTRLYVAGSNMYAGSSGLGAVASWDGSQWRGLSVFGSLVDLVSMNLGGKRVLVALGQGGEVLAWDGVRWSFIAPQAWSLDIACHSTPSGDRLVSIGTQGTFEWNGSDWVQLGVGPQLIGRAYTNAPCHLGTLEGQLIAFGRGASQPDVDESYAWRSFDETQRQWVILPGWDAVRLQSATPRPTQTPFAEFGAGPARTLHALASPAPIGTASPAAGVLKLTNGSWQVDATVPAGPVLALATRRETDAETLYFGGLFPAEPGKWSSSAGCWRGGEMNPLGTGLDGTVHAIAVPPGSATGDLRAVFGGAFTAAGAVSAPKVAGWDGSTWRALGSGFNGSVRCLTYHAGSAGEPRLIAGGTFTASGATALQRIAAWDGTSWTSLGGGFDGPVLSLATWEDEEGRSLIAAGQFSQAGGVAAGCIARWDGSTWSPMGVSITPGGMTGIHVLAVHDDGSGPALYAGGFFGASGGIPASMLIRWDGTDWSAVGQWNWGWVRSLVSFDDGTGPGLYAWSSRIGSGELGGSWRRWDGSAWQLVFGENIGDMTAAAAITVDGRSSLFAGGDFGFKRVKACLACPADLNGDDRVGGDDLGILLGSWGVAPGSPADINEDSVVDGFDLGAVLGAWGTCGG
jgi:hypothetical protein